MRNNRTARHGLLPWKYIRPRSKEKLSVHFEVASNATLCPITHDYLAIPLTKRTPTVCFILKGDLKWNGVMHVRAAPPPTPTCSYRDDMLYWNMRTQLTLLPWQPSQRITVLQHRKPPTPLPQNYVVWSVWHWWDVLRVWRGDHNHCFCFLFIRIPFHTLILIPLQT